MRRKGERSGRMSCLVQAGVAYVYLIYGMYHCLNVVTEREEISRSRLDQGD